MSVHKAIEGDRHQRAFIEVRVFHPYAPSYRKMQLPSVCCLHECQKQRSYDQGVRKIEDGIFTALPHQEKWGSVPP